MQEPAYPADEAHRIATLRALGLLETPGEERFDRLTRLAAREFNLPVATISLVDSDRVRLKSAVGLDAEEIPRPLSLCGHTILEPDHMIIPDMLLDPRFADNPLVAGEPGIRCYAGKSIHAADGAVLGTVCVLGYDAREFDAADLAALDDLAALVEKEINLPDWEGLNDRLQASERELIETLSRLRANERYERSRNKSLELISRGYPLHEVLASIAFEIEQTTAGSIACVELQDNDTKELRRYWSKREARIPDDALWHCRTDSIHSTNGDWLGRICVTWPQSTKQVERQLIEESTILAAIAVERDLSDRMIWKKANYDGLTGLPNRNLLGERLGQELNKARRHRLELGLMFIDLDHFKKVNDTLGHHKGDELLGLVGHRLMCCMRDSDTVARLGGDEFTVIAVELGRATDVERIARKILTELAREFRLGEESVLLSASIGIAFYPDHGEDMDALMQSADRAMYTAKNSGGNQFTTFSQI